MLENICGNCHKSAYLLCTRCNIEYYCSKKCQITAFPAHRRECFPLPTLKVINGDQCLSQTSNNSIESVDSDKNTVIELKMSDPETKTVTLQKEPSKKEIVVEEVKEKPKAEPIKKVETKELVTPAFNAGIRTVAPSNYQKTPSVVGITKAAVEEKEKVVEEVVKPAEKQGFSMETIRRNQQSSLVQQQQKKLPQKDSRVYLNEMKVRQLKMGKIRVKIVGEYECPKSYYVTEADDAVDSFLEHIEVNINDFVKNEKAKSYKAVLNEIVLARFEGIYYRAVIKDINADDPSKPIYGVFFIDYGNESQVLEADLLPFSPKLKGEIILNPVLFENFPSAITKKLEEIVSSADGFDIIVKDKTDKCYIADIVGI